MKIYHLLSPAKRRASLLLLGFIIIGTALEILGIGLLLPIMMLMVEENIGSRYPSMQPVLELLGNPGHESLVLIAMSVFVVIYLIKNIYLAFLAWQQARFSVNVQVEISRKLFKLYMCQPYSFHLQRNSAQLIRNITGEINQFVERAVNPVLTLTSEILVLGGVVTLLIIVEPLGTFLVFSVFLTVLWIFYRSTRARITRWGEIRQFHDAQRIQHLH